MDIFSEDRFSNEDAARAYLEASLWPEGPICPHCGSIKVPYVTLDIAAWDGAFQFEVGVRNEGTKEQVLEGLRERLALLFQSAAQQLAQGPLQFRETQ